MHHKSFNPDLRVVSGMIGLHESEINKLAEKEAVEKLFQFSTSLKNLDLALDEIILVRGISVTFAGNFSCLVPSLYFSFLLFSF